MSPLLSIILIAIAVLTVGLTTITYLRARSREATPPPARAHIASQSAPVAVADEVRAIGEQIERAMAEQRIQGETQRQLLTQKLDSVRQSVDGQRTQVDGLRSELRHEVQRRDAELEEIRQQLGSIARGAALPPAAMPALAPAPEPARETATAPMMEEMTFAPSAPAEVLGAPTAPPPANPEPSFSEETFAEASVEEVVVEAPAVEETGADASLAEEAAADEAPTEPVPAVAAPTFEESTFGEATFEEPGFEPAASEVAPAPPPPTDPFADLTFEAPEPEVPTFEESLFEDASFEESPFEEASFDDDPEMDSTPPATSFEEARFDARSATPTEAEDAFAAASLHIGGDSAPAGDAFDEWTPEAVAPVAEIIAEPAVAPISPMTDALVTEPPTSPPPAQALPDTAAAWVARPGRPDGADPIPTAASTDDFVFATPAPTPEPARTAVEAPKTGLIDMDDLMAPPAPTAIPADAAPEPVAPEPIAPPPADATPEPVTLAPSGDAEPMEAPEVAPTPEGAEDLTVISTIDEDVQRLLYLEGVLTLEEIAQWGRGQARRISTRVEVSEETIMNQWVFEAQAAMFSRYAKQATG
ncbi:hypothetical protein [Rubrivirga sp. IMCC43871]|uniref:hypothetical protein n=1 Tax=Rubrivirga sp. IMCC43871 TaxID=3391575 RepID=UPI00399034FC